MGLFDAFQDEQFRQDLKKNARDFTQSASNTAASLVTGPVDIMAWLLKQGGLPIDKPVGGSDWATDVGLMRNVDAGAPKIAGETFGLLAPLAGTKQGAQAAAGLLNKYADNLAAPKRLNPQTGAIVWHGSPHKFDKFDSSKIGTGEGAQAYGHGLYLAEAPDVAQSYQKALSNNLDGRTLADVRTAWENSGVTLDAYSSASMPGLISLSKIEVPKASRGQGIGSGAMKDLVEFADDAAKTIALSPSTDFGATSKARLIEFYKRFGFVANKGANRDFTISESMYRKPQERGNLYKVDLPDEHIAKMLDWDKPLSQQAPEVQAALGGIANNGGVWTKTALQGKSTTGGQLYMSDIQNDFPSAVAATEALRKAGIPGIRYLDGGSRGAGAGSSNYVVFPGNEDLLRILERNGIPIK